MKVPVAPRIVIDTREQTPWTFPGLSTVRRKLRAGDVSHEGCEAIYSIERKTEEDALATLTVGRERFENELAILATYPRAAIIIETDLQRIIEWEYRSRVSPLAIVNSLASFSARFNVPTLFAGSRRNAEFLALSLLLKWWKYHGPHTAAPEGPTA